MNRGAAPRDRWLVALVLIALCPLGARLSGHRLGSFGMFTGFERFRLGILRRTADGTSSAVPFARLAPHLGSDARRVILPAEGGAIGEAQVGLLAGGLDDLGRLVCAVDAEASEVELRLQRSKLDGRPLRGAEARVACRGAAR